MVLAAVGAGLGVPACLRAGFALVARGEFSIVIAGIAVAGGVDPDLRPFAAGYVLVLAVVGPLLARVGDAVVARARAAPAPSPGR